MYGTEMAKDVLRLLDHLKIKRAHMIGYSMGAFIVGKIAATHPERLLTAIYGGQGPIIEGTQSKGSEEVQIFAKAVDDGKGLGPYIVATAPAPKPTLEMANAVAKVFFAGKDVKAWALAGLSLGALEVKAKDLAKCKAPSLFIYGENESDDVKESVAAALKVLPGSELKVVRGGNHITTLAKPEFGATIIAFLRAHMAGSGKPLVMNSLSAHFLTRRWK
jgi:pimeloyl-ACP methyl ester carboxylesterase